MGYPITATLLYNIYSVLSFDLRDGVLTATVPFSLLVPAQVERLTERSTRPSNAKPGISSPALSICASSGERRHMLELA